MLMIGKVSRSYRPEASAKNRTKKGYGAEGLAGGTDQADFSSFAVELARK